MIPASQIRTGMAIRYQDQPYKVLAADYHPGQGKMGGANHVRLRNLTTGTVWEHSLRAELRVEELPVERQTLEFLYQDGDDCVFMNTENYEQVTVPSAVIGDKVRFVDNGTRLPVEFVNGLPISVVFPDVIDIRIADTAPPLHGQPDGTWKPARFDNGVEIMVPPFVKTGDTIRLNLETMKYMDRVRGKAS